MNMQARLVTSLAALSSLLDVLILANLHTGSILSTAVDYLLLGLKYCLNVRCLCRPNYSGHFTNMLAYYQYANNYDNVY